LVARDASRKIETMKSAVASRNGHRQFRVLEVLGEGLAFRTVRFDPSTKRYPHAMGNRVYRLDDIPQPRPSSLDSIDHCRPVVP
jgi:hypothetical protein